MIGTDFLTNPISLHFQMFFTYFQIILIFALQLLENFPLDIRHNHVIIKSFKNERYR